MMSSARRNLKRFKPQSEVQWLDHSDRARHRTTIRLLTDMAMALESGTPLTPAQEALVYSVTQSDVIDTRINAAWNMLDQTTLDFTRKLAEMAPYDLTAFHEVMNPDQAPAMHQIMVCEELMKVARGETNTLLLAMPRGAAKTTLASKSFAQWWMGLNPDKRVLAVGHGQKWIDNEISKPNRTALESDNYRLVFPDVELNTNERAGDFWRLQDWKGSYTSRGALAGILGVRSNLVLADDLFKSPADALSEIVRENIWNWFTAAVMPTRLPYAPIVMVNTLWHSEDVMSRMIKMAEENPDSIPQPCKIINIPCQCHDEETDPLGRKLGEWIWPEFYPPSHWENLRNTMPPTLWSSQFQGIALDKQGDFVAEEDFKRYETLPVNREGHPIQWTKTVMSVDTPLKGADRSDYTAILIFRRHVDGTHYLVDAWRGKKKMDEIIRVMSRLMTTWECGYALVEDSAMGAQILQNYGNKMPCPMVAIPNSPMSTKEFRFDAASTWITSGKVLFPQQAPWLTDLINEFISFPNGSNDDQVDAFSQYCQMELKRFKGGTKALKMRM